MNVENIIKSIHQEDGLSRTLGMEFISTPEDDTLKARMAVDDRNKQPFGFLAGGASLALAENLAGVGSMALCPGKWLWALMCTAITSRRCHTVEQLRLTEN